MMLIYNERTNEKATTVKRALEHSCNERTNEKATHNNNNNNNSFYDFYVGSETSLLGTNLSTGCYGIQAKK